MRHVEERLRRSLATRADDVHPDPATWDRLDSRLHRRAWVGWSAAGVAVAAAAVAVALIVPGLLGETRVELSPADPPPGPAGATTLVTTDGSRMQVTDLDGQVLGEVDPPADAAEPLPITRLAVQPGSTPDDLTVVYLRADADCERVEVGWVRMDGAIGEGGVLGGGQGYCATDPVWSPDGAAVAWMEQEPGGAAALQVHGWGPGGPGTGDPATDNARFDPDLPVGAVRATDWWWTDTDDTGVRGVISLSVTDPEGETRAFTLAVERQADGAIALPETPMAADPADDGVRSAVLVSSHDHSTERGAYGYELGVDVDGTVLLSRLADHAEPDRVPLDPAVLAAEDVDRGEAWLTARGDTVVFGHADAAWVFRVADSSYTALPGVVHAAFTGSPASDPAPESPGDPSPESPAPDGPPPGAPAFVATDGGALTLTTAETEAVLARAADGGIADFAVRPSATPDDLTLVWRDGEGCGATLRHLTLVDGEEAASGTLPASCPGRPAFAPDGRHLAWVSEPGDTAPDEGCCTVETLDWADGPGDAVVAFDLAANPAEIFLLELLDWVWVEGTDTATAGHLLLAGTDTHGTVSALTAPVERQDDGALALPAGATAEQVTPFVVGAEQERFAVLQADSHQTVGSPGGPRYRLERHPGEGGGDLAVVREGHGETDARVLPAGLLRVNTTGEVDAVWMTARGDDVLLGDGADRAWWLRWTADGWVGPAELDHRTRFAVPLAEPAGG